MSVCEHNHQKNVCGFSSYSPTERDVHAGESNAMHLHSSFARIIHTVCTVDHKNYGFIDRKGEIKQKFLRVSMATLASGATK